METGDTYPKKKLFIKLLFCKMYFKTDKLKKFKIKEM